MKFSSFSSVLNFHCMSTQMVPRANNDPYVYEVIISSIHRLKYLYGTLKFIVLIFCEDIISCIGS